MVMSSNPESWIASKMRFEAARAAMNINRLVGSWRVISPLHIVLQSNYSSPIIGPL